MEGINNDFIIKQNAKAGANPCLIDKVAEGAAITFCGRGVAAYKGFQSGNKYKGTLSAAQQLNKVPDMRNDILGSVAAFSTLWKVSPEIYEKIAAYSKETKDPIKAVKLLQERDPGLFSKLYNQRIIDKNVNKTMVTEFGFFKDTFLETKGNAPNANKILKTVNKLDKNLLDTSFGNKIVNKIDKNAIIKTENVQGKIAKCITTESKSARFAARALGRVPLLNVLFAVGLEIPTLLNAPKEDFGKQALKSGINVGMTTLSSALLGALLSPLIPPIGSVIGTALGLYIGNLIGKEAGKGVDLLADKMSGKQSDKIQVSGNQPAPVRITA